MVAHLILQKPWPRSKVLLCSWDGDQRHVDSSITRAILLAAPDNRHSTQLTFSQQCQQHDVAIVSLNNLPLWNFSSMGGTIMRTLRRRSLVVADILLASDIAQRLIATESRRFCNS